VISGCGERAAERHATIASRRAGVIEFAKVDGDFIAQPEEEPMGEHTVVRDIGLLVEDAGVPVERYASQRFDSMLASIASR
jgi:hypothetical protein